MGAVVQPASLQTAKRDTLRRTRSRAIGHLQRGACEYMILVFMTRTFLQQKSTTISVRVRREVVCHLLRCAPCLYASSSFDLSC